MVCGKCWNTVSGGVVDGDDDHPYYRSVHPTAMNPAVFVHFQSPTAFAMQVSSTDVCLHSVADRVELSECCRYGGLWKNLHKADQKPGASKTDSEASAGEFAELQQLVTADLSKEAETREQTKRESME